jgi:tetratricopeptide (TPR) repeat protein
MKRLIAVLAFISVMALSTITVAQSTGSVKGTCKDQSGNPIAGAVVQWSNTDNGRNYEFKTNKSGEYFSLGVSPGNYTVTLKQNGKELFHFTGVHVALDEVTQDFDLKKEMTNSAQAQGMTPEQLKAAQEQQAKAIQENMTIKTLNEKLAAAKQSADAGDFDAAAKTINDGIQVDPNRDLLWAKLGEYTLSGAAKQSDAAAKEKAYSDAVTDYQKAIDLREKLFQTDPAKKTPESTKVLAQFYNNMGKAAAMAGKTDDMTKAYTQAAQLDPANAGMYYFNLGGTLTNLNSKNDPAMRNAAVDAFNKAIAADPTRADAYYWKGSNLIGLATLQGDKMVAPDGTAESFQKYLELQPTGPHAEEAKAMLSSLGASVETSYGTTKKKPKK